MTTYTREQIEKAKHLADLSAKLASVDWHEQFLKNLGITVEDPKPEPGVYLHQDNGQIVILIGDGCKEYSQYTTAVHNSHWVDQNRDKLTPARVVPADPVELSKAEVGRLYDSARFADPDRTARTMAPAWAAFGEFAKDYFTGALNAALAKYGHGN